MMEEWFAFTAMESGTYLFYTGLDTDTYGEIGYFFKVSVPSISIASSTDAELNKQKSTPPPSFRVGAC